MKRELTQSERTVITRVAERLPVYKREQLLDDLAHASAEAVTPDGSRVIFHIRGYERPPYRGQHSFGVQGELVDCDGQKLSLDLYADENDHLLELEVIRWQGALMNPDWSSLKLY